MKFFNEPTANSKVVVTDQELYEKALRNYKAYCTKHGHVFQQPSPALTEFNTMNSCFAIVTLHNNETCRNWVFDKTSKLYDSKITVTTDPEESYIFVEKGVN